MNMKVIAGGIATAAIAVVALKSVNTLDAGEIHVKQSVTGDMSVITQTGPYVQALGDVYEYSVAPTQDITVRAMFKDGSEADVTAKVKMKLPRNQEAMLKIHEQARGERGLGDLLSSNIRTTIRQVTSRFDAEDAYSNKKAELIKLIQDSIVFGQYATDNPEKISKESILKTYGIEAINIDVDVKNFDEKTTDLIAARKEAEQKETLAKAEAMKAKQDAITAEEKGKANVATAKYQALVVKEKAVIEAQKATAVQQEVLEQQKLKAQAELERGRAQAEAAKLKVAAGLTPLEEATIEKETAIGVAQALSKITMPSTMVIGGENKNGQQLDPFMAVGLESLINISKGMATAK